MLHSTTPLAAYRAKLASGALMPDRAQRHTMIKLESLYRALTEGAHTRKGLLARVFRRPERAVGLYLWGGVGRGKSMLMDMFVDCVAVHIPTKRVHFHAFMRDVHARLHAYRKLDSTGDILPRVVKEIAAETRLLCLDEFQVHDVTDAMILSRLFTGLMDAGVHLVFTSNRHPRDLYQGGLQREQFMLFVREVVEARLRIHELKSDTDYRMKQLRAIGKTYMFPRDGTADDFLLESWNRLTGGAASSRLQLKVQGRTIEIEKHHDGIAWVTFGEICVRPLGAADYLEIAAECRTILLQGIPQLSPELRNEAKRFVTFIDALYEARVKLICTAATAPEDIYPKGDGNFEFGRTVSRLHEMQSEAYLALPHLTVCPT
jgi:cell division protein ZapE